MDNVVLVVITALISGLLATLVTIWWQRKSEIRNKKMKVFETLMTYRYMISSQESVNALNSIDVVFYKDKNVRKAFSDFLNETDKKPEFNPNIADKHLKLLEEISKALHLKEIHWDDIKQSYYPNGLSEKVTEEELLRKMQIQSVAAGLRQETAPQNTPAKNQFSEQMVAQLLPALLQNPESLKMLIELGKNKPGSDEQSKE